MDIITIIGISSLGLAIFLLLYAWSRVARAHVFLNKARDKWEKAKKEIEVERREMSLKMKDEIYKRRKEFEFEVKRERLEFERKQEKLNEKHESVAKKDERIEETRVELQQKERELSRMHDRVRANEVKLKKIYDELLSRLETVGNMSREDAKKTLFETLEAEVQLSNEKWIQKVEEDARILGKQKAIDIIVGLMQRFATDQVAPHSSGVVQLPNEEMKGRIIGKEGRNIKALEMATGMELVIGDSPEIITISGFNPIRREVARRALMKLIADGRINPTRIEETVEQCEKEIDEIIEEYGKAAVLEFNLRGIHPDIVTLLGKLHFRTSFSQNVLLHAKEVGLLARMIAEELGIENPEKALRAGLLHDIGKAVSAEVEGPHALIGADIAKRCGELPEVVNAIAAHHEEVPFTSIYAPIVVIADIISASRPGARRETFTTYVKRLEKLEEIANKCEGVKKAYALQAGREIRVIVQEQFVDDERAIMLAREIARMIEKEMNFPGQIKVNVIRESRSVEYAK